MLYDAIKIKAIKAHLTIGEVERGSGVFNIWRWNRTYPSADKVYKVAKFLGCTVEELMEEE